MEPAAQGQVWFLLDKPGVELFHTVLTFRVTYNHQEQAYEAECVELGVPAFGETLEGAIEHVEEATSLYLNTIEQLGERARVFDERGIDVRFGRPAGASASEPVALEPGDTVSRRYAATRHVASA